MINPYFIHVISFIVVIIAYLFHWSGLYPKLSFSLILFLLCTIIIALLIGSVFVKEKIVTFKNTTVNNINFLKHITYAILFGYGLEFLYHGTFPLLAIFLNSTLSYHEFGIPVFHVLLVTFNSFFSIYLFQVCLSETKQNRKTAIFLLILNLIPSILIMNRGMLIIILMSIISVYLIKYERKLTFNRIAGVTAILLIALYLFGVLGNIRVNNSYQTNTSLLDSNLFLEIGGATDEFKKSVIPKEFFWGYIYLTSPLANLQKTIDEFEHTEDVGIKNSFDFATTQLLPDFISKRLVPIFNIDVPNPIQITPELNVSTALAAPYTTIGWVGISLFILVIFVFAYFYILFLKKYNSEYFIAGVAIMNSIFLFNIFSNMFSFTGLSFQLVYPVIFTILDRLKVHFQKV
ncbi:oligosaccharide repeat unit polymerase [Caldibacillus thermoamylovorans]|uniref:O-antigen polymerase n=1 Tax=Caldibacillus thermoamylovorans TaxID=35841 RepID=UPI001D08F602|nr:O-antigen polymerase [Caldibacillus thermoamylovorans]MCB5935978.1 oligosaccharide repeat unit polymerase [Bacillus sp. DFI.2.34]MCB7077987.1 oligosaccharide repeat unit polymerase [Caldibacillus thermoamylovorans]